MSIRPNFPITRLRRTRYNEIVRDMIAETTLSTHDLIMPLFVCPGENVNNPISSMPGNSQLSVDLLVEECKDLWANGVKSVLLFGIPEEKDNDGTCATHDHSIVQKATRAIKESLPQMYVIADICNCEYTKHGHCGTIVDGDVENDQTLETLCKQAVSMAKNGVDMVAPSDMMDGRIGAMRRALDDAGYYRTPIMAYSAKYASGFYGPFREAAESTPKFGNRATYQMDPRNSDEAVREMEMDVAEGADIIMVKPALSYLDIIYRGKQEFNIPMAAYHVSGEFAMIKAAAENDWIDGDRVMMEAMYSIKRAGADIIITYFAKDIARILNNK